MQLLSGERRADAPGGSGVLRLVTVTGPAAGPDPRNPDPHPRQDAQTGKPLPTGLRCTTIEANRDRDCSASSCAAGQCWHSGGFAAGRTAPAGELVRFRLPLARGSLEARFLRWSGRVAAIEGGLLLVLLGCVEVNCPEGLWWIATE